MKSSAVLIDTQTRVWRRRTGWLSLTGLCRSLGLVAAAGACQTAWGVDVSWTKQPGAALHISSNATGSTWVVGTTDRQNENGYDVYKWSRTEGWVWENGVPPSRRLSVNSADQLWIVNDVYDLFFLQPGAGAIPVGKARDVAVGGGDSVWVIGTDPRPGGYGVYQRTGSTWSDANGGAVRIAVDASGRPWVVNQQNQIYMYNTAARSWELKPGKARSIHTGASGAVWMLGVDPVAGGFPIYQWNAGKQNWDPYGTFGAVEMTEAGIPWIVQQDGSIYSRSSDSMLSFNVTGSGSIVVVTPTPTGEPAPAPQPTAQPSGKLLCAVTLADSCGDTKADYVGPYTLDTTCDAGFYDPIWGGTCWKCPDDTDDGGAWIRSATAIEKNDACWRVPKEKTGKATKVRSPSWSWDCPSGSFWDIFSPDGIGGSCWTCPADLPRRTGYAVWADNACATPVNETKPAIFLTFNGCPTPNAEKMDLPGKRSPGRPFLDIGAGWNQGVASGGCYACPVTDEAGDFLVSERNANPIYDRDANTGCTIKMKWQPPPFYEPGLAYMQGVKDVILEQQLFDGDRMSGFLYDMAEARGLGDATPEAKAWVAARWQEIARNPYNNEQLRTFVFALLKTALRKNENEWTPGERKLIESFASYVQRRRTYLAEQALAMYDAWKAWDDQHRQDTGQTKSFSQLLYYGTVPLDFPGMLGSVMGMSGFGGATIGAMVAAHVFAAGVGTTEVVNNATGAVIGITAAHETSLVGLTKGLKIFLAAGTQGLAVVAGATIIAAVAAIAISVAGDQFEAIQTTRPRLEASLAQAKGPVDLNTLTKSKNGEDMLYFFWAKAMDTSDAEDLQVVQLAAQAQAKAEKSGYLAPPKTVVLIP
jgi:hypothetical protein